MMIYSIFRYIRTPIRNLWFDWTHRRETPEQRKQRIAETKIRFREIYNKHRERWMGVPANREWQEFIEMMDECIRRCEEEDF